MSEKILIFPGSPVSVAGRGQHATAEVIAFPSTKVSRARPQALPVMPANIIPFPHNPRNIISLSVHLGAAAAGDSIVTMDADLPGVVHDSEKSAHWRGGKVEVPAKWTSSRVFGKRLPVRVSLILGPDCSRRTKRAGTSSAQTKDAMKSSPRTEPDAFSLKTSAAVEEYRRGEGTASSPAVASIAAKSEDNLSLVDPEPPPTVDRIFCLLLREALVARQYGSQSMAAVLRPDDETELVLHFSQRNGRLEATVRCERGDVAQLRGLWGHVQHAMAAQRVEVGPLEPPLVTRAAGAAHDQPPRLSVVDLQHDDSLDEGPLPASSGSSSPHVRRRPRSRTRLATSRPGWETWA